MINRQAFKELTEALTNALSSTEAQQTLREAKHLRHEGTITAAQQLKLRETFKGTSFQEYARRRRALGL